MKTTTFGGKPTPETGRISAKELRNKLYAFEEYFRVSIEETVETINNTDTKAKTRKTGLSIQVRTSQAINAMLERDNPVVAFIEAWGFVVRLRQYLEEGEGNSLFGENQHLFVETAAQLETRIESIGRTFMNDNVFEENRKQVYSFARSNPIKASFSNTIVYSTMVQEGKAGAFESLISIPLSPVRAMEGVDRTATAVDRFTDKAARFSDVVEELPESVRLQLLALLYDFEETEMTRSFLTSLSKFSDSSQQLAETTKNLPQEIREQISTLVEEIDNKQANLQTTLDKTKETLAAADQTLAKADQTAASFKATVSEINRVAIGWDKAAVSTQQVLSELGKLKPARKDPQPESAFKIKDVHDIVEAANQTVGKMENVTAQLLGLVESEQLAGYASMPVSLVNLLAWRIGQLIVMVFVLAIIYRYSVVRITKKRT